METNKSYHTSILLHESVDLLITNKSGIYIDATFGGGGHSKAILNKLNNDATLIAFDQDIDAQINILNDPRFKLIPENFKYMAAFLKHYEIDQIDGIIADLGVSSFHFDTAKRGFSYRMNGPLDMRMDQRTNKTAASILAQYSANQLQQIFQNFGEVSNAKTLGKYLVEYRLQHKLETIFDLKQALQTMIKGDPNKYFAKVFQSLRIEVNEELESLKMLLNQLAGLLKIGGRAVFISFHSLED
ncbi:MAG: 16S rRNA (cytosine(1402)-N(4))-methyltransferase RsmH, partial [Sediminibacterium sp.]|nr:16S rRNA (cytosine(1402)-N(4))-methyltransferase RsmH [Sediminibacterium sp.]